jgi:hypothetical protein
MYFSPHIPPELHTSLTHPRKILSVVLKKGKIGKAKDLSAPVRTSTR